MLFPDIMDAAARFFRAALRAESMVEPTKIGIVEEFVALSSACAAVEIALG